MKTVVALLVVTTLLFAKSEEIFTPMFSDAMVSDGVVKEGRILLPLPLIYNKTFFKIYPLSQIITDLKERVDGAKIIDYDKFAKGLDSSSYNKLINYFEPSLFNSDILESDRLMPLFNLYKIDFIQIIRIEAMGDVTLKNSATYRFCKVECEIFNSKASSVIWRGSAEFKTDNIRMKDVDIIQKSIKIIYKNLPNFYYPTPRKDW
jgi:hypothetical protein